MAIVTKTVKPAGGGDYTSMAAWDSAEATNLTSAGDSHVCDVYAGGNAGSVTLSSSWASDSTNTLTIKAADGEGHEGIFDTNKAYLEHTATVLNGAAVPWVHLEGLQFSLNTTNTFTQAVLKQSTSDLLVSGCFFKGGGDLSGNCGIRTLTSEGQPTIHVWNNVFYDFLSSGSAFAGAIRTQAADDAIIYNNTFVNCRYSVRADSGTPLFINNVMQAAPTYGSFDAGSGYNLTDQSSAPGSNNIVNTTLAFTDAANDDFSLAAADTAAIDVGVDLTSDTHISFADDAVGTSRPQGSAWDIGAFEYTTGVPATPTIDGEIVATVSPESEIGMASTIDGDIPVNVTLESDISGTSLIVGEIVATVTLESDVTVSMLGNDWTITGTQTIDTPTKYETNALVGA